MVVLRLIGKLLVAVGAGVLLFVGWMLWGTGAYADHHQDQLQQRFERMLRAAGSAPVRAHGNRPRSRGAGDKAGRPRDRARREQRGRPGDGSSAGRRRREAVLGGPTRLPPKRFSPAPGDPVFRLRIPAIDLDQIVVEGVGSRELERGPGHYPSCRDGFERPLCTPSPAAYPGEDGRVVISGHRTTYGAPFWALDRLRPGDRIRTTTTWGKFNYRVRKARVVAPRSRSVIRQTDRAELVLTTCTPRFSAARRLVIYAAMKPAGSAARHPGGVA